MTSVAKPLNASPIFADEFYFITKSRDCQFNLLRSQFRNFSPFFIDSMHSALFDSAICVKFP